MLQLLGPEEGGRNSHIPVRRIGSLLPVSGFKARKAGRTMGHILQGREDKQ